MEPMKERGPLGELILTVRQANGWSQQQVADRACRAAGEKVLSKQRVHDFETIYPLPGIQRSMIHALADGLGISPHRIALAAVLAMGFRLPEVDITPAEAIQRDPGLSADTRGALLAILRSTATGKTA